MNVVINELNSFQINNISKRIPHFELSYEKISHKKVFPIDYSVYIAIPTGKKYCVWFSFDKSNDACYLIQLNKNKKIQKMGIAKIDFPFTLALGTMLYGTMYNNIFIIEDIFYYKGICLKNVNFNEKFSCIKKILQSLIPFNKNKIIFAIPCMWKIEKSFFNNNDAFFQSKIEHIKQNTNYVVHHIQFRKTTEISPYINVSINIFSPTQNKHSDGNLSEETIHENDPLYTLPKPVFINSFKPLYKQSAVFRVVADIQFDIYHLYAIDASNQFVYYNIACIPDLKTSVFMNSLFRNIRENNNIDYIEESDDEFDFENVSNDKYVNLEKHFNMECIFHFKFKKWIPIRVASENNSIVNILLT
jgi:hypothetical protein